MGLTIEDVLELSNRELVRWQRYWAEEPWGAYRDNVHAAMIICQLLKPHLKEGAKLKLSDFMLVGAEEQRERERANAARTFAHLARKGKR